MGHHRLQLPDALLHRVSLLDVAPVLDPAYRDTSATARNMAGAVESLSSWVGAEPTEVRSMLEAGQAMRFFKRTDRPSLPKAEPEAAELRMVDDIAVAEKRWRFADEEPGDEAPATDDATDSATEDDTDGERAMNDHAAMCKQYTDGEPCVKGTGHDGDHAPRCRSGEYGTGTACPCAKPSGHMGPHVPMAVDDEQPQKGPGRPKKRDGEDAGQEDEVRTLSGLAAIAAAMDMRQKLTPID